MGPRLGSAKSAWTGPGPDLGQSKEDIGKVMKMFMIGTLIKVKSCVGFRVRDHTLSLVGETVDVISRVDVDEK